MDLTTESGVLEYIRESQTQAVRDLMNFYAKDGVLHESSQYPGRSGGTFPLWYGADCGVWPAIQRIQDATAKGNAKVWMLRHFEDTIAAIWQAFAVSGFPPGEYCSIENGVLKNGDTDKFRHIDIAGLCDVVRDFKNLKMRDALIPVAIRVGQWITGTNRPWWKRHREFHRFPLPGNSLVAIYELTGDRQWLQYALWLLHFGWGDQAMRKPGPFPWHADQENPYYTFDTGAPWEERGGDMAHATDWPWYEGTAAQFFLRLFPHAPKQDQDLIADRILKLTEKYVEWGKAPVFRTFNENQISVLACPMHGGQWILGDSWRKKGDEVLTPEHWLARDPNEPYHQLRCLYWRDIDGDWESPDFVDEAGDVMARRDHHPRTGGPPKLARDGFEVADLLYARYLVTQDKTDWLRALWYTFDYVAFANQSGHIAFPKSKASPRWLKDAAGPRGNAWRFLCGHQFLKEAFKRNT